MKYLNCPWQVPKSGFACWGVEGGGCFSFIHVEYNWHWSVTVTENCQAVRRQPQLHWRPVLWQKQTANMTVFGEPRQGSPSSATGDRDKLPANRDYKVSPTSATATYFEVKGGPYRRPRQWKCRRIRRPRQISKWGAAGIGDRDKKVSPTSATATDFRMRGGRYRRPRQKRCRRLRRQRKISK